MNAESKLPDFEGKTPKEMRRDWLRFMADQDWTEESIMPADWVRMTIEMLILNEGLPSEVWARKCLDQQLAIFLQQQPQWRGE